ncbi:MAG: Ig-like domain-containing protein [Candidatus Acidiferrales bacterium]
MSGNSRVAGSSSSSDPNVATVDSTGLVTAVGPGKTTNQISTPSSDDSSPVRVE